MMTTPVLVDLQPLYIQRKLVNAQPFIEWAKSQGFPKVLAPEELHVTVVYSHTPVNWDALAPVETSCHSTGGPRQIIPLGSEGAVVLKFQSADLADRHQEWADAGASWDYDEYQCHVTITYNGPNLDLTTIKPYTGVLEFGPEIYEPINKDYAETVVEKVEVQSIAGFGSLFKSQPLVKNDLSTADIATTVMVEPQPPKKYKRLNLAWLLQVNDEPVQKGAPLGNQNAAGPHKGYTTRHVSAQDAIDTVSEKARDLISDGYDAQENWSVVGDKEVFDGTYSKTGKPTINIHFDGDKSVSVSDDQSGQDSSTAPKATLSEVESKVLEGYADEEYQGYKAINGFLRGRVSESRASSDLQEAAESGYGADLSVGGQVKAIDGIMSKSPLSEDTKVYRGGAAGTFKNLKVGDTVTDKGYMSTSTNKEYAAGFGLYQSSSGSDHVLEMTMPKGTPHVNMAENGGLSHEGEILTPRGSSYKVTGHRKEKTLVNGESVDITVVTAEYLPPVRKAEWIFKGAPYGNDNAAKDHKGGGNSTLHTADNPNKTYDGKEIPTHTVDDVAAGISELESKGVSVQYSAADFHEATMGRVHPVEMVKKIWGEDEYANGDVQGASIVPHTGGGDFEHLRDSVSIAGMGTVHGAKVDYVERNLLPGMQTIDHTYLRLADGQSDNGAVKKMFDEAVPAYKKMGIKEISLHANLEGGAYAWSKYGFAADHPPHVNEGVERGWANIVKHATESVPKEYRPKLSTEATKEMNALRDILANGGKYSATALANFPTPNLDAHFGHVYGAAKDQRIPKNVPMTFIKTAMSGQHWTATHRFDDPRSAKQLSDYLTSKPKKKA